MNDFLVSLIRTWVPIIIGTVLSWLASVGLDLDLSEEQIGALVASVIGLYYSLVRALEQRWPAFGYLLGSARQPNYVGTPPPP